MLPRGRRATVAVDVAAAVGLVAFSIYAVRQPWDDGFRTHAGWLDTVAVAGMAAPFALRTLAPSVGVGLVLAVNVACSLVGPHSQLFYSGFVPLVVMVYAVARHDDGWWARLAWLTPAGLLLGDFGLPEARSPATAVFGAIFFTIAWAVGRLVRVMVRQKEQLEKAVARLDAEREAGERTATELERGRIAAEMHDVVGHALSLMVLQTGAARTQLGTGPAADVAREQLRLAETTGRGALEELRRTLGTLRRGIPHPE